MQFSQIPLGAKNHQKSNQNGSQMSPKWSQGHQKEPPETSPKLHTKNGSKNEPKRAQNKPVLAREREARLNFQNFQAKLPPRLQPKYARCQPLMWSSAALRATSTTFPKGGTCKRAMSKTTQPERRQEREKLLRICTKTYIKLLIIISKSM